MAGQKTLEIDILGVARLLSLIPKIEQDVEVLKSELKFWRELALSKQWVDRKQAKEILGMCDATLQKVANDSEIFEEDSIRRRYTGSKPYYSIEDIRKYLLFKKSLSFEDASRRIISKI